MNQKQAILIFFLCLAGMVLVLIYFFCFFPTGPGTNSVKKSQENRKNIVSTPALQARKKIRSTKNEVDKLLEIIKTPSILDPTGTKKNHAQFRALALHNLATMKTKKAQHAYLKLLDGSSGPTITLATLSAIEPKKATPKIRKIVKTLILHTRNKFVRAKASLLYEKLSQE